jgi:hypothetical protein
MGRLNSRCLWSRAISARQSSIPGATHIVGAAGPASIPVVFSLLSLVSVDPQTGIVTYNPSSFSFLGVNETAQYVIGFESQVGDSIVPETLYLPSKGFLTCRRSRLATLRSC